MAVGGVGILDSDLAHDVYNEILDLYDAGLSFRKIEKQIATYEESLLDDLDWEIYLTSKAKAYWEIGLLSTALLERVTTAVEEGKGLKNWIEAGGEAYSAARQKVLSRFIRTISTPKEKSRPRKEYAKVKTKLFRVGDCLVLREGEEVHRGVVCQIDEYRGECTYDMLVMERSRDTSLESFLAGRFVGRRIPSTFEERGWTFGPAVVRPEHGMILREGIAFEVVGHVDLDPSQYMLGSFGGVLTRQHVVDEFRRIFDDRTCFGEDLIALKELLLQTDGPT